MGKQVEVLKDLASKLGKANFMIKGNNKVGILERGNDLCKRQIWNSK